MNTFAALAMRTRRSCHRSTAVLAALAACFAMAGCAHNLCPSFQAAWYLEMPRDAGAPTIRLALLNDSTQAYRVEQVFLNPTGRNEGGVEVLQEKEVPEHPWKPGRLYLLELKPAELDRCHLPVAVRVRCSSGEPRTQEVSGRLPNYLPEQWITDCAKADVRK